MPLMGAEDFSRLRKLLAMTASDADGEALSAIRKANAMMERNKVHWFDLLDAIERGGAQPNYSQPRRERPKARPMTAEEAQEVQSAFEIVLNNARTRGSFRDFILDLNAQWEAKGTLSEKQRAALMAAAERARAGGW